MKAASLGIAGALLIAASAASAQPLAGRPITVRPHAYVVPPQGFVSSDELRDYQLDQLENRQEAELRALELRQMAERRAVDPDED